MRGLLCVVAGGLGERTGDINHGQQAEYICLNKTGEEIEIAGENSRYTVRKNGDTCQKTGSLQQTAQTEQGGNDAENEGYLSVTLFPDYDKCCAYYQQNCGNDPAACGDEVDHCSGGDAQSSIDEGGDNTAAGHITEVTECHGNRLSYFGNDVHGSHDHDGLGEALEPAKESVILDVVIPYYNGNHYCPYHNAADVGCGGAQEAGETDKGAADRGEEDGTDEWYPVGIVLAHGLNNHLVQHHYAFFNKNLLAIGALLQVPAEADAGGADDNGNNEQREHCLSDVDTSEYRYGEIYKRTCDIKFHSHSPFFLKNSAIVIVGLTNARGSTRAITLK